MVTFDWSISLGSLITAASMLGGIVVLSFRLGNASASFETLKSDISDLQKEMRQIAQAMSQLAVQDKRIEGIEEDVREIKADIRELRHGEGFVLPIKRGAHEAR